MFVPSPGYFKSDDDDDDDDNVMIMMMMKTTTRMMTTRNCLDVLIFMICIKDKTKCLFLNDLIFPQ